MAYLIRGLVLLLFVVIAAEAKCTVVTQRIDCGSLTCNTTTHECGHCTSSDQCYESGFKCNAEGRCVMMDLAESFGWGSAVAPIIAIIVSAIAAVSGVGGGAILVPTYIWLFGLPVDEVVPLAQASILGQAAVNALLQLSKHHPHHSPPQPTWPLINWEYLLMLLPSLMVGTMVGGLGNAVSPGWFRVGLLMIMQVFVLYRLVNKAIAQKKKDQQAATSQTVRVLSEDLIISADRQERDPDEYQDDIRQSMAVVRQTLVPHYEYSEAADETSKCCGLVPHQERLGHMLYVDQKSQYPWRLMLLALLIFTVQLIFVVANSHSLNLVSCGSTGYWLIYVAAMLWSTGAATLYREYLLHLRRAAEVGLAHRNVVPFKWNKATTIGFPIFAFFAGAAASMLGSGSGMILNFVLLEADLLPEEVSATGGVATVTVAAQAVIVFILQGDLEWDFGLYVIGAGVISAFVGQYGLIRPIKKRGLTFLFIVSLVVIMVLSLGSLTAYGIYETYEIISSGGSPLFGQLCPSQVD